MRGELRARAVELLREEREARESAGVLGSRRPRDPSGPPSGSRAREQAAAARARFCPACGAAVTEGWRFCAELRRELPQPARPAAGRAVGGVSGLAVEARGLEKRFGAVVALRGVDLALPRGSALAVLGPNGAGKSTLLKVLAGLTQPSHGTVRMTVATAARALRARPAPGWATWATPPCSTPSSRPGRT